MTSVFAPVREYVAEEVRRTTDVTYHGYVYGMLAALRSMLPRDRGVIVNVGSALAYRSIPLQAAYCGAKHAMVGFTDSLRCELIHDRSHVKLSVVHLPAMNTPQFEQVRSKLDHDPQPVPPIYQPEVAARAIVRAAEHPAARVLGGSADGRRDHRQPADSGPARPLPRTHRLQEPADVRSRQIRSGPTTSGSRCRAISVRTAASTSGRMLGARRPGPARTAARSRPPSRPRSPQASRSPAGAAVDAGCSARVIRGRAQRRVRPLRSYAAIGDGRTLALVAPDGAIDWLCAPEFDGESVFGALLDAGRGGALTLRPDAPFAVERRYLDATNVLETTFTTSLGVLRVTDAMQMDDRRDAPFRTVLRRVECLAGSIDVAWSVAPRFAFGQLDPAVAVDRRRGESLEGGWLSCASHAFALGEPTADADGLHGLASMEVGDRGLLAVVIGEELPPDRDRDAFELDLDETARWWRAWSAGVDYDGPWQRGGAAQQPRAAAARQLGHRRDPRRRDDLAARDAGRRAELGLPLLVGARLAAGARRLLRTSGGDARPPPTSSGCASGSTPRRGRISVLYDLRGAECAPERELAARRAGAAPGRYASATRRRSSSSRAPTARCCTRATCTSLARTAASPTSSGAPSCDRPRGSQKLWHEPDAGIWEERGSRPAPHALQDDVGARPALRVRSRPPGRPRSRARRAARSSVRRRPRPSSSSTASMRPPAPTRAPRMATASMPPC